MKQLRCFRYQSHNKNSFDLPKMGLKMREIGFQRTYIFKIFQGSMPPDPPRKVRLRAQLHFQSHTNTLWKTSATRLTYLQKWRRYCSSRSIDPICPSVEDGINFLAELYDSGIGYSAVNTAKSALSSIVTLPDNSSFGAHPMVCRFLEGVFELKPSLPKYENI